MCFLGHAVCTRVAGPFFAPRARMTGILLWMLWILYRPLARREVRASAAALRCSGSRARGRGRPPLDVRAEAPCDMGAAAYRPLERADLKKFERVASFAVVGRIGESRS
jgi:hypothetical protein